MNTAIRQTALLSLDRNLTTVLILTSPLPSFSCRSLLTAANCLPAMKSRRPRCHPRGRRPPPLWPGAGGPRRRSWRPSMRAGLRCGVGRRRAASPPSAVDGPRLLRDHNSHDVICAAKSVRAIVLSLTSSAAPAARAIVHGVYRFTRRHGL